MITLKQTKPTKNFSQVSNDLILNKFINIYALRYAFIILSQSDSYLQTYSVAKLQSDAGFSDSQHTHAMSFFRKNGFCKDEVPTNKGKCMGKIVHFDFTQLSNFRPPEKPNFVNSTKNAEKQPENRPFEIPEDNKQYALPSNTPTPSYLAGGDPEILNLSEIEIVWVKKKCSQSNQPPSVWLLQFQLLKQTQSVRNPQAVFLQRLADSNCIEALNQLQLVQNEKQKQQRLAQVQEDNADRSKSSFKSDDDSFDSITSNSSFKNLSFVKRAKEVNHA